MIKRFFDLTWLKQNSFVLFSLYYIPVREIVYQILGLKNLVTFEQGRVT